MKFKVFFAILVLLSTVTCAHKLKKIEGAEKCRYICEQDDELNYTCFDKCIEIEVIKDPGQFKK